MTSSSLPLSSFSWPATAAPSSSLMFHWKRRESSLLSEVDELHSALELSRQQQRALLEAQDRLVKERQQWEADSAQQRAQRDSAVHQLEERLTRERGRRKMLDGELRALKRLREEAIAQRVRHEVEHLQQSEAMEASADKSQALYERLLTEQRQHEEALTAVQQRLDEATKEKTALEAQLKASEDVIASLLPLETEVEAKAEEVKEGRRELEAAQQQTQSLDAQCQQLSRQLADAHSLVDSANRNCAEREDELRRTQQRLRGVEAESKAAREDSARAREETAVTGEMLVEVELRSRQQAEQLYLYSAHTQRVHRLLVAVVSALHLPVTLHPVPDLDQQTEALRRVEERVVAMVASAAATDAALRALEAEVRSTKASLRVQSRRVKEVELQMREEALAQREARHCHHKAALFRIG